MPYLVRYSIDSAEWRRMMQDVRKAAADLTPVLKQAGEYMLLEVDDRFKGEHDSDGKPWKPLAQATLLLGYEGIGKSRRRSAITKRGQESKGFQKYKANKKILQGAGTRGGLRGSITYRARRSSLDHGTNKIYGAIQQLGGKAGRGKKVTIPARPYLGYSEKNLNHIRALVSAHIESAAE